MGAREDLFIARSVIENQVDLLRLTANEQREVLLLLDRMGSELEATLNANITPFRRARTETLLKEATDIIDRYYTAISATATEDTLVGVAQIQSAATRRTMAGLVVGLDASVPSETFLRGVVGRALIQGARSALWWKQQSSQTKFHFSNAVRQGLVQGETNETIVRRVTEVVGVSKRNARSLVHTSIQSVANATRLETFKANDDVVKGVRQLSTLDSHTTEICIAYAGKEWDLEGNPIRGTKLPFNGGPPRHWNCRSVLTPITKTFRELGIDIDEPLRGVRASAEGPTRMTMKQWIDSRTVEQLDEQLGKGRARLYRNGTITLNQLLDLKGNPLTLTQLKARYA